MSAPNPDRTPNGLAYEGRLLPRPDDEVVDQGLGFDVATLLSRRRMFRVMGLGVGALTLAACSTHHGLHCGHVRVGVGLRELGVGPPGELGVGLGEFGRRPRGAWWRSRTRRTAPTRPMGPMGWTILTTSGIVRRDIRSSFGDSTTTAAGVPLRFEFTVLDMANENAPFAGVAVYAWHCDRSGDYSLYSDAARDENFLRGVQIADDTGRVSFTSIFPACYAGRWPHIHFEVYPDQGSITDQANAISTSQMALPKDVCDLVYATEGYEASVANLSQVTLASDNVFGDDAGVHQVGTVTGDVTAGYLATLTVPVDTRTQPTGGNSPAGGGPGRGGPGGTPPGGGGAPPGGTGPSTSG